MIGGLVDEDDWVWFAAEQPDDDDGDRAHPAGCLLVILVCVLFWVLIVAGAVIMYPK